MKKIYLAGLLVVMFVFVSVVQAQTPQETLNQYIADLRKKPDDNALREKIIRHVQTMRPAPAIPVEVDELVGQAKYAFKHAKSQKDYLDAVEAYKKVVTIVPWVADYYYNLGVAQEQAGQLEDAIKNFNLYLLAPADAKDAREARERIGGLKYAAKKAERASSQPPVAEVKRDPFEDLLRKINGRRYTYRYTEGSLGVIDVMGKMFVMGTVFANGQYSEWTGEGARVPIVGRETAIRLNPSFQTGWAASRTYIISEDGERLTLRARLNDGSIFEYIYLWQR